MAMMFRQESFQSTGKKESKFDAETELKKHSWHPYMKSALEAEQVLSGKPAFTHLIRPCDYDRGFMISFVNKDGDVAHDHFSLIDPLYGIWRNAMPSHVGKLEKVLRDMMDCALFEGQPLK